MPAESTLDQKLQEAHRRRIAAQLPSLGWAVMGGAVLWLGLVRHTDPGSLGHTIRAEGTLAILAFQILAFAGATVLCRRDPSSPRVTVIAVATTIVVGLVWVWVLTATATIAATLMFATLTLFSAAPLVLAWRLGPQLVFQGSLSIVWILALPVLPRLVPLEELVFAIGLGNFLALCATQWAVSAFHSEVLARFAAVDFDRQITASRDAYRALAENAVDFIWAIDLDGRWTYVNEALARRCGMSAASMIGRSVTEILTADSANPDPHPLIVRVAAGEPIDAQLLEMRTPDGTCWVEARAVRVHDAGGRVIGIQGVSRDVTAQRAAEAALRASERWFRTFAESMAAGVLIAEADGIAYVNDALSVISGYSRDELLRMQVWDLVHPEERATARAKVKARLDGARLPPHAEYRMATKSGEPRWVDITVAMLELDGVVVMLGTAFDVTERKLAEQALRASEARYRGLVESQREIVLRFDASGIVTFANDAYCATYGVSRDETLGKPFWPLVHPDDVEALQTGVEATMQAPFRGHAEVRSLTTTGWRWFEWEGSAIRDSSGTVLEGQAAGRDVTERRRAQDDLRASLAELRRSEEKLRLLAQRQVAIREEERKRLSFDLHDDVCQELVGIGILIESVQGRLGASPPETPHVLTRATRYLSEVVEHLRVLARDLRPMSLHDLGLEASLRSLAAGLSSDQTTVQTRCACVIPRLPESVEVSVYRIVQEAVTNAVRHAEAHHVTVTLGVIGDRLELEVHDDGRGFDVAESERHACGLASMEERAQAIAGRFTVTSLSGAGTTIRLDCPLAGRSASAA